MILISWLIRLQGMGGYEAWKYRRGATLQSSTEMRQGHQSKGDRLLGTTLHYLICPQSKFASRCHLSLQNSVSIPAQTAIRSTDQSGKLSNCRAPIAFKMRTRQTKVLATLRFLVVTVQSGLISYPITSIQK